jgi:hypothetical protein
MARPAIHNEGEIKIALQMLSEATILQELRQGQAIAEYMGIFFNRQRRK